MVTIAGLAETAALVGDPARAAMLVALLDGRALTAGELARVGGVSAQTASGHLARLLDAGMVAVVPQGRHRYFRIARSEVAASLESLLAATFHRQAVQRGRSVQTGPRDPDLRRARVCYDHLAGALGVALFDAMAARGQIRLGAQGAELSEAGQRLLVGLGISPDAIGEPGPSGHGRCRPCLDWSERRDHLAGRAAAAICTLALDRGWVRRAAGTRAVNVTAAGALAFGRHFGIEPERWGGPSQR